MPEHRKMTHAHYTQDVQGIVNIMQNSDNNEKNPQRTEEFQITITSEVAVCPMAAWQIC
jgi:hypothetical protein